MATELATAAAWTAGGLAGVALGGLAYGVYRGWAPITVVRRGALIIFTSGSLVTALPINDIRGQSVEVLAQNIERDATQQDPKKSLARAKTLVAATIALKMIEDSEA